MHDFLAIDYGGHVCKSSFHQPVILLSFTFFYTTALLNTLQSENSIPNGKSILCGQYVQIWYHLVCKSNPYFKMQVANYIHVKEAQWLCRKITHYKRRQ